MTHCNQQMIRDSVPDTFEEAARGCLWADLTRRCRRQGIEPTLAEWLERAFDTLPAEEQAGFGVTLPGGAEFVLRRDYDARRGWVTTLWLGRRGARFCGHVDFIRRGRDGELVAFDTRGDGIAAWLCTLAYGV